MADVPIVQPAARRRISPWHTLIVAGLIGFAITAGVVVWFVKRTTEPAMGREITQRFAEYVPTVGAADGILETATSSVPEVFTRSDSAWLFNVIPLGTTVSEIRVPAVYRYHIRLFDPWKLMAQGQVCLVMAPQFQASVPPAIVTGQMEKSTSAGWLRFNAEENLAALEKGITDELNTRADDKAHRDYVREACRKSVAAFVKTWLMKEDYWREDKFHQIVVVFPDEVTEARDFHTRVDVTQEGTERAAQ
jgi:hypothetical protein